MFTLTINLPTREALLDVAELLNGVSPGGQQLSLGLDHGIDANDDLDTKIAKLNANAEQPKPAAVAKRSRKAAVVEETKAGFTPVSAPAAPAASAAAQSAIPTITPTGTMPGVKAPVATSGTVKSETDIETLKLAIAEWSGTGPDQGQKIKDFVRSFGVAKVTDMSPAQRDEAYDRLQAELAAREDDEEDPMA